MQPPDLREGGEGRLRINNSNLNNLFVYPYIFHTKNRSFVCQLPASIFCPYHWKKIELTVFPVKTFYTTFGTDIAEWFAQLGKKLIMGTKAYCSLSYLFYGARGGGIQEMSDHSSHPFYFIFISAQNIF
jgi:hypothetical protein